MKKIFAYIVLTPIAVLADWFITHCSGWEE